MCPPVKPNILPKSRMPPKTISIRISSAECKYDFYSFSLDFPSFERLLVFTKIGLKQRVLVTYGCLQLARAYNNVYEVKVLKHVYSNF